MTVAETSSIECYNAKLERRIPLPPEARAALLSASAKIVEANQHDVITREGSATHRCLFVCSGFVSRQRTAEQARHIMAVGIPGERS